MDDEGLHRDDLIRSLEPILIEPGLCPLFVCVERRHQFPPLVASDWAHSKIATGGVVLPQLFAGRKGKGRARS